MNERPEFVATAEFRFHAESIEAASAALRSLQETARREGIDLRRVTVLSATDDDQTSGWTGYGPPAPS